MDDPSSNKLGVFINTFIDKIKNIAVYKDFKIKLNTPMSGKIKPVDNYMTVNFFYKNCCRSDLHIVCVLFHSLYPWPPYILSKE